MTTASLNGVKPPKRPSPNADGLRAWLAARERRIDHGRTYFRPRSPELQAKLDAKKARKRRPPSKTPKGGFCARMVRRGMNYDRAKERAHTHAHEAVRRLKRAKSGKVKHLVHGGEKRP